MPRRVTADTRAYGRLSQRPSSRHSSPCPRSRSSAPRAESARLALLRCRRLPARPNCPHSDSRPRWSRDRYDCLFDLEHSKKVAPWLLLARTVGAQERCDYLEPFIRHPQNDPRRHLREVVFLPTWLRRGADAGPCWRASCRVRRLRASRTCRRRVRWRPCSPRCRLRGSGCCRCSSWSR